MWLRRYARVRDPFRNLRKIGPSRKVNRLFHLRRSVKGHSGDDMVLKRS